ncbi:hypothetical protein ABZ725_42070 [Streptomyces sp. NPDC006872]|uniref:hypothetical protein n=1 Tax=Streptomyces sp. NPDC006872 TaxID=3155720 RepID=UPI0033EE6943
MSNDDILAVNIPIDLSKLPAEERQKVYADLFHTTTEERMQPVAVPKPVTDADLKIALRTVAVDSPGYVYESPEWMEPGTNRCYYVHRARENEDLLAPGCMVAYALNALGVPLAALKEWESCPASDVVAHFFPQATEETLYAYNRAQSRQDIGKPWGTAIRGLGL